MKRGNLDIYRNSYKKRDRRDFENIKSPKKLSKILKLIGKKRGMLISGGEIDTERAANLIFDEYRDGKFGNITLEYPEE